MPDASIDRLTIEISAESKSASQAVDELSKKIDRLASSLGRLNGISLNRMTGNTERLKNLSSGINSLSGQTQKATKSVKSLVGKLGTLYAASRGIQNLWKSINSSMDYVETLNYFDAAFGQVAKNADLSGWKQLGYDSAEAYYNSFGERAKKLTSKMSGFQIDASGMLSATGMPSLGIDPEKLMNYQAMFGQMSSSMGVVSETALKLSDALSMIGADLASVKNLDFDKVWNDMASGLAGMSRTLDKYGVNIRNVNLQQKLNELGIKANIQNLNQNEKALLRTTILLESTKYAWGDLADTLDQPANQLRLLSANFQNLARAIGNLFLPVIQKVLPYINGLVIALQRLVSWVGGLIGLDLSKITSSIGGSSNDIGDFLESAEDASDALGDAAANAKKLKTITLGIDELNINSPQTESGSGTSGSGIGGGVLDDAFLDAFEDYQKAWEKAFEGVENKAQDIADRIANSLKKIWEYAEPAREALKRLWNEGLKQLADFTAGTLVDFYHNFLVPVGKWVLGDGLPRLFDITNKLLKSINWRKLQNSLNSFYKELEKIAKFTFKSLLDFYEDFLAPVAKWTMNKAIPTLVDAFTDLSKKINWNQLNDSLSAFWEMLSKFVVGIGSGLIYFFEGIEPLLTDAISSIVNGLSVAFEALFKALSLIPDSVLIALGGALGGVLSAIITYQAASEIMDALSTAWTTLYVAFDDGLKLILAHPYVAVAAGIAAVVGSLASLQEQAKQKDEIEKYGKTVGELVKEFEHSREEIERRASAAMDYVDGAGAAELQYAQDLKEKYFELAGKQNKTNEEYDAMRTYVSELSGIIPDLNKYIDSETGLFDVQADSIQELIDKQKEYYKIQAAKDKIIELYKEQIDIEEQLQKQTEASKIAAEEYYEEFEKHKKQMEENEGVAYQAWMGEGVAALEAKEKWAKVNEELDKTYELHHKVSDSIENLSGIIASESKVFSDSGSKGGEEYTKGVADSINKQMGWDSNATKNLADKINDEMGWNKLGKDAAAGYAKGMEENKSVVEKAGEMLAEAAMVLGVQDTQDSHSPSKEFEKLGKDAVDGYNLGITNNIESSVQAVTEWVERILETMRSALGIEEETETGFSSMFGNITPKFISAWENFSEIWQTYLEEWKLSNDDLYFGEEVWNGNWMNLYNTYAKVWSDFTKLWKTNLDAWWKISVVPYFLVKQWTEFGTNMKNGIYAGFKGIVGEVGNILNGMIDVFDSAFSKLEKTMNKLIKDYNKAAEIMGTHTLEKVHYEKMGKIEIPAYSVGGFPEDGWFRASKGEYFGQFDDGTSYISNNNQIENGIASGVRQAVREAMSEMYPYLADIAQNTRETADKDFDVNLDGRSVVDFLNQRVARNGYSFTRY